MKSRRVISFNVSAKIMETALGLPNHCEIIGTEWNHSDGSIKLFVESERFPEIKKGERCLHVEPELTSHKTTWDFKIDKGVIEN